MANSASDARHSEAEIRKNLIKSGVIGGMLTLPKNMFYTVTLPGTLWFFSKNGEGKEPKILFIDARNIFRQVDRATVILLKNKYKILPLLPVSIGERTTG
jgi:type I restriction enzyme M protein